MFYLGMYSRNRKPSWNPVVTGRNLKTHIYIYVILINIYIWHINIYYIITYIYILSGMCIQGGDMMRISIQETWGIWMNSSVLAVLTGWAIPVKKWKIIKVKLIVHLGVISWKNIVRRVNHRVLRLIFFRFNKPLRSLYRRVLKSNDFFRFNKPLRSLLSTNFEDVGVSRNGDTPKWMFYNGKYV